MKKRLVERKDVDKSLTWDLSQIYKTEEDYKLAVNELKNMALEIEREYKGKLNSSKIINECLDKLRKLREIVDRTTAYASLSVAVDNTNYENQNRAIKLENIVSEVDSRLSFINSELMDCDENIINEAISESEENKYYLIDIKRWKPYALHPEAEKVLSSLFPVLESPYDIYESTRFLDMPFKSPIANEGAYSVDFGLLESEMEHEKNNNKRRTEFKFFYSKLREYQNTLAAAYKTQVQKEKILANLRGFDSTIDRLLYFQKVDRELYNRQIDLIMEKLSPHMRKYAKLIKKIYNLDEMTFADLKLQLDPGYESKVTAKESKIYMEGALSILGEEYLDIVKKAYNDSWIDFPKNKGKSPGAFCAVPYRPHPFILISWTEKMREMFVLAHEFGHAGHFYLCDRSQSIFGVDVSQAFVEAPSTLNELLMANYLMKINDEPRFRRWVLSLIVGYTYYHNFVTHFLEAAYQREVYNLIEQNESIQAKTLNTIQKNVLEKFWGEDVKIIDGAELTWMRQPHFYMGLYSYTYIVGLTIATEVNKRILKEGKPAADDWVAVLKAGGTKTPVELAKMAGVDITTGKSLLDTIEYVGKMIDEIISLTEEIERKNS